MDVSEVMEFDATELCTIKESGSTCFSGDDFSIQNSAGQDAVRCHGQAFSWRDSKGAYGFFVVDYCLLNVAQSLETRVRCRSPPCETKSPRSIRRS